MKNVIKEFFKPLFVFDLRSLSLMRVGIALALLTDLLIRLSNIEAHYTDQGVLPLEALFRFSWNEYYFSLYTISGSIFYQFFLFLLNLCCILCLLMGYRTKIFTVACWIFLLSLHNRNPLIHQGGDDLLRLVLFWGIFLPWNYYYSMDARKISRKPRPYSFVSVAGFAFMLQVGYVYFFSALLKSSPEWRSEYSALYYALSLDQLVLPVGKWIYPFEELLKVLTMGVYYIEWLLPLILLLPFFTNYFRFLFVLIIGALHIGISLCLNVGLFPLIGIVTLIGLLPGGVSHKIADFFSSFKLWYLGKVVRNIFYSFGKYTDKKESFIPYEGTYKKGFLVFFSIYIFLWNLSTIHIVNFGAWLRPELVYILRIDQHWGMFSPAVFKDDGWFIFSAYTNENKAIDVLQQGNEVIYRKLAAVSGPFKEDRWRKFSENMLLISNSHFRPYYCDYLLTQWNNKHRTESTMIHSLQIIYMKEISLPGYKVKGPDKEILCECKWR